MASLFDARLVEMLGTATDTGDIRAVVRPFWKYEFASRTVRVWRGQGPAWDADGNKWLGTIDGSGTDHHKVPKIRDGRDGNSQRQDFGLMYIDAETYELLKSQTSEVEGQPLTLYWGLFSTEKTVRIDVPLKFHAQWTMKNVRQDEKAVLDPKTGKLTRQRNLIVAARGINVGRSQAPRLTATPQGQRLHADLLGVSGDKGMDFVPGLANRTYVVGG